MYTNAANNLQQAFAIQQLVQEFNNFKTPYMSFLKINLIEY